MGSIFHIRLTRLAARVLLLLVVLFAVALLLAASCASSQPATQVAVGRDIAIARCSSCHAIDAEVSGPNPEAPPLKTVLWRYNEERLADDFIEAVRVGHGDMPVFDFNPAGTDALIAYLKSIKSARDPEAE
ncbi:MAG: cytochrome c [Alphaproteobacteria bacterium]|nr:cytochrome c [Alphaproteobacteria bacterium]